MKIVIANSIGVDDKGNFIIHSPSHWSEGVKNKFHWFAYYPWELAYLSSLLKKRTEHDIKFLDGCLMRLDRKKYYGLIVSEKPDVLIMESATRMIDENLQLALDVKHACDCRVVFVGAHASAYPEELIEAGIDNICLGEYEYTVLELVQGESEKNILGLYPNLRRPLLDINSLPWPEDDDVKRIAYAQPGEPSSEFIEVQMYASRGCPGSCNFCVARHVYYDQPNWRHRNIEDIIKEIEYLKGKYPQMEGVFFDEEAHNIDKNFIMGLTQAIRSAGLDNLYYEAMCDIRFLDEQMLLAMKQAGYYKLRVGIETASEKVMENINKTMNTESIKQKLQLAKKIGLKTYGTFTFGAWGATKQEDEKTITFMKDLINRQMLDNLQVSICTPHPGNNKKQPALFLKHA